MSEIVHQDVVVQRIGTHNSVGRAHRLDDDPENIEIKIERDSDEVWRGSGGGEAYYTDTKR